MELLRSWISLERLSVDCAWGFDNLVESARRLRADPGEFRGVLSIEGNCENGDFKTFVPHFTIHNLNGVMVNDFDEVAVTQGDPETSRKWVLKGGRAHLHLQYKPDHDDYFH